MKVRFLKAAMRDMQEIKYYISKDNPAAAKRLLQKIRKKTKQLVQYPFSGRIIPETNETHLRELIIDKYRIMYQISNHYINVFAIYESHREYSNADDQKI
jgi:toxin ParE1/3/4